MTQINLSAPHGHELSKHAAFAARLDGREYRNEITKAEESEAAALGLIVAFGASDDLLELRGAVDDEIGAWGGKGVRRLGVRIRAEWCPEGSDASWVISTTAPHSTFNIKEDGEVYCVGVVIEPPHPDGKVTVANLEGEANG